MHEILVGRDPEDLKKHSSKGMGFIGRHYVGSKKEAHLTNDVRMDLSRPHVIGVFGKRGCLKEDTLIFTNHGFKPIKEFDREKDKIYSHNKGSFKWETAELVRYPVDEPLIKLDFKDGQSLIATIEHPLLVFDGKKTLWKEAKDITKNDAVVATVNVPEVKNDKESLRIARLLGFILADGTMRIKKGRWKDGRGYWYNGYKRRVRIFNACEELLKTAKRDLEKEFRVKINRYKRNDCNCEVVQSLQGKVVEKFRDLGVPLGNKSAIIRVPKVVFESSNRFKANFLKALFSCDGTVRKDSNLIEYYSKSKEFLLDLQLLLQHFGIHSRVCYKKSKCNGKYFDNYRLYTCDYTSIKNFERRIGLFNKNKMDRLKKREFRKYKRRQRTKYLTPDTFCLKVSDISKVNGIKEVYDLHVQQNHSFIANGVISHNTGKSYTLGDIAEEIMLLPADIKANISGVIIDTMGIFWSLKNPNEKDFRLLSDWKMKPIGFDVIVLIPEGQEKEFRENEVPFDGTISLKPSELNIEDWALSFSINLDTEIGILLSRVIKKVKKTGLNYSLEEIISGIKNETAEEKIKESLINRFVVADDWGIFSKEAPAVQDMIKPGKVTVIDVSLYGYLATGWSVRTLIVGLLARKILEERMKSRRLEEIEAITGGERKYMPIVWMLIDESHMFLPAGGTTAASGPLLQWVKIGREPGVSLVLATQQPNKLHEAAISQCDLVISHRLTSKQDIDSLKNIMQTYLKYDLREYIDALPRVKGAAIILDDNSERLYPIRVRPRMSWHAGGSPIAVKE